MELGGDHSEARGDGAGDHDEGQKGQNQAGEGGEAVAGEGHCLGSLLAGAPSASGDQGYRPGG